jgi:hypothetical protein
MTTPLTAASQLAAMIAKDAGNVPEVQPQVTSNAAPFRAEAVKRAEMYGVAHARGEASLTKLAFFFSAGVRDGALSEGDADALYAAFVAGHNRHIVTTGTGHEMIATDEKSLKVPTSIFRTFGKRGPVAMGPDFYQRVLTVRHAIGPSDRLGSAYNAMVKCNREVVKLAEKAAVVVISDDDIRGWISKPATVDKTELDKLAELVTKIAKLAIANPVAFAGLTEPTAALETFVAQCKLRLTPLAPQTEIIPADVLAKIEAREETEEKKAA